MPGKSSKYTKIPSSKSKSKESKSKKCKSTSSSSCEYEYGNSPSTVSCEQCKQCPQQPQPCQPCKPPKPCKLIDPCAEPCHPPNKIFERIETVLCSTGVDAGFAGGNSPLNEGVINYTLDITNNASCPLNIQGKIFAPLDENNTIDYAVVVFTNGVPSIPVPVSGSAIASFTIPACSHAFVQIAVKSVRFVYASATGDRLFVPPIIQVALWGQLGIDGCGYTQPLQFSRVVSNGKCLE